MTAGASAASGYSLEDLRAVLGLPPARVREWLRAGFLAPRADPGGEPRFTFQDLVLLRAAQGLVDAGIPPRRVKQALAGLEEQLPAGRSLASLRVTAEAGQIVVRDGGEAWDPVSGQAMLDFEVAELAREARPFAEKVAAAARDREAELDADAWFELGLDLEGAERHYRLAAALSPGDGTVAYNLGVALADLGRLEEAAAAYQNAIAADPACADAYFNLAGLYEKLGEKALALRHLKSYRQLVRGRR